MLVYISNYLMEVVVLQLKLRMNWIVVARCKARLSSNYLEPNFQNR
jgi:hypothetical protein